MAVRATFDDKLAAVRQLRDQALSTADQAALRKYVGDRSNFVVAAAVPIVAENAFTELAVDLETAFDRFMVNPLKDDKNCLAKIAIVQALDKMEHQRLPVFQKAAIHAQFEPVWGGSVDTAIPLRAAAIIAVARIEGPSAVPMLIDAMIDPAKDVRIASAIALGAIGTEAACLLLRLKARIGDADSEVFSECLSGLLMADPRASLPFVREYLEPGNETRCEAAALALGKSRLQEALAPLTTCVERCHRAELKQRVLLSIAMLRLPTAMDYLVGLVTSESEATAAAALSALKIHAYDPRLRVRIATVVTETKSLMLQAQFQRDFPSEES